MDDVKCERYIDRTNRTINRAEITRQPFESFFVEAATKSAYDLDELNTYFFNQGYFINMNLSAQIFDKLADLLDNYRNIKTYDLRFVVTDSNKERGTRSFNFTIQSEHEFRYAVNLLRAYRGMVKPFFDNNKELIEQHSLYFDRVFAIVGSLNDFALGKSFHNTRVTMDFSIHYMEVGLQRLNYLYDLCLVI